MDRGRGDGRAGSKRSFDEFDSDAGRRLEQQLRGRLELAEERRQREREADRDWDRSRNRSPEWRSSEERHREEEKRFTAGPSRPSEQQKRKKVGVKKYSSKSRASTMATITPTPTPPPPPQTVPSLVGQSSRPDPVSLQQSLKKPGMKCFNCGRDGHYQSACLFKAHCSVCEMDGHTTGMCPKASKLPSLQWYGYGVDGVGFHCLEVEEDQLVAEHTPPEHEAIVIAGENRLTCDLLSQDLKALVEDKLGLASETHQ
jgi:hypothetical protein